MTRQREIDRLDALLAKWGVHVGAPHRPKRRALALKIAKATEAGWLTDDLLRALQKEGENRRLDNPGVWIAGVLDDDLERAAFVGRIRERMRQRERIPNGPDLGDEDPAAKARASGLTLAEWEQEDREGRMRAAYFSDLWPLARIADFWGVKVPAAEEMIDRACWRYDGVGMAERIEERARRQERGREKRRTGWKPDELPPRHLRLINARERFEQLDEQDRAEDAARREQPLDAFFAEIGKGDSGDDEGGAG